MTDCSIHVYDIVTGKHVTRLPFASCSWTHSLNKPGSMSVDIAMSRTGLALDLHALLMPWRVIIAYRQDGRIVHAGPLTSRTWSASDRKVELTVGGGWTLLTKRLVIGRRLVKDWRDHSVVVDEQKPAGDLALTLRGPYYRDIACQLVDEALQWGALPVTLPGFVRKGSLTRTYYAWDLATVADRLTDLTNLENGIEASFTPRALDDGSITFDFAASDLPLIKSTPRLLDAVVPAGRCILESIDADGSSIVSQIWLTGGKDHDRTLMCRRTADNLTGKGWPLMMGKDTEHTTVSIMKTLQSYAIADLQRNAFPSETFKLKVGEEHCPEPGDLVDVRVADDFLGDTLLQLKVTDVSGTADSDWVTVEAQERS